MRTEVIKADSVAEAAERILDELKEDDATTARSISSRNSVIYFDGWDGLGASAVLRAVAQRLTAMASSEAPAGLQFDQIIHIDCAKWESRRSLQRAVAEQLELPAPVMDMFDKQDEEDDFNGVAKDPRFEIPQVVRKMYEHIQKLNHRFLVIFHNGSDEDVDLATICGFPLSGYSVNKVLWTFQGAFRLKSRNKVDDALKSTGTTDVFFSASGHNADPHKLWNYLVLQDAAEVARRITTTTTTRASAETSAAVQTVSTYYVANYFLYMWKLCGMVQHFRMDYDMATHGGNYWIYDGVIQLEQGHQADIIYNDCDDDGDGPWRAAAAVQQGMRLDSDYYHHSMQSLPSHLMRCADSTASTPYWTSPLHGVVFFSTGDTTLQHFSKLGVLKLSRCTFSFSSPPFVCCSSLRLLWLDHCQDQVISKDDEDGKEENNIYHCFKRLWVLDVRYTRCDRILSAQMLDFMTQLRELNAMGAQDWDIGQLHGRLPNIRKLRVTKSIVRCSGHSEDVLFSSMNKLELLDFSGNRAMQDGGGAEKLFGISTSSNQLLETVMINDGCAGIQKFSFRGCSKLMSLFLSGLFEDLRILDFSGTSVKTLDLSAMTARSLNELILDNCDKLCAILWPPEDKRKKYLEKLHMDTTWSAASLIPMKGKSTEGITAAGVTTSSSASLSVVHGGRAPSEFNWCIRVRDARLLRSLVPFIAYFDARLVHVEIYSPVAAFTSNNNNKAVSSNSSIKQQHVPLVKVDKPTDSFVYADVEVTFKDQPLLQPSKGDAPMLTQIWPCPSIPSHRLLTCYTHIQDHQLSAKSLPEGEQTMTSIVIPDMICHSACILHVHDSLAITSIPGPAPALGSAWPYLEWCRVERCPKLEHAFTAPQLQASGDVVVFYWLKTFWASELPKARYIWNWTPPSVFQFGQGSFEWLKLLHMDLCPRVIHVLPLALPMVDGSTLGWLETLEIVWCADLREVFPLYTTEAKSGQQPQQSATTMVHFYHLKRIHLHELPKLQGICGRWRISAPKLETVKIRGCWSLKRLPAVSNNTSKKVECDCEKEWWDALEWDGLDADHHPSLYKATHSRYYKKTLLKGSVLR